MDARTALTQIAELVDDVQAEFPEVAARIQDAVGEARSQSTQSAEKQLDDSIKEPPADNFRDARKAAMADKNLFGRNQASESEEPSDEEGDEDEEEKKKRDRVKARQ